MNFADVLVHLQSYHCSRAVSYTHLDVYKRQLKDIAGLKPHDRESITKYLQREVESMINEGTGQPGAGGNQDGGPQHIVHSSRLPLIRLRVDYSAGHDGEMDYQVENARRFSNRFVGKVANTNNVVQLYKKKKQSQKKSGDNMDLSLIHI